MPNPVQNIAEGAADLWICRGQIPPANAKNMQVALEGVNTPAIEATCMQPVQPLGCSFHPLMDILPGKNDVPEGPTVLPTQNQDLPDRVVSERLSNREAPSGKATAP